MIEAYAEPFLLTGRCSVQSTVKVTWNLAFDIDQIGEPRPGHARGLQPLGHGGEFAQSLNELLLFLNPLLIVAGPDEGRSRRRDLGALFSEAERGRHTDNALRGYLRHRPVDVGEGVPCDRAGATGQHPHASELHEQFALDAKGRLAIMFAARA